MHVVRVVSHRHLTMVNAFVLRHYILYDEIPFVRTMVVVDAYPRILSERKQTNRERVRITLSPPRHLGVIRSIIISQGSVVTQLGCGGIFNN